MHSRLLRPPVSEQPAKHRLQARPPPAGLEGDFGAHGAHLLSFLPIWLWSEDSAEDIQDKKPFGDILLGPSSSQITMISSGLHLHGPVCERQHAPRGRPPRALCWAAPDPLRPQGAQTGGPTPPSSYLPTPGPLQVRRDGWRRVPGLLRKLLFPVNVSGNV